MKADTVLNVVIRGIAEERKVKMQDFLVISFTTFLIEANNSPSSFILKVWLKTTFYATLIQLDD